MTSPPKWYTVVAIVALLWNLLGCFAFLSDLMIRPEDIARLTADQQALYTSRTWWSIAANAMAVLGGAVGSLGLILRKRWTMLLLISSFVGLIIQDFGLFIIVNGAKLAGPVAIALQSFVFLIAIGLISLARMAANRGWIPRQADRRS